VRDALLCLADGYAAIDVPGGLAENFGLFAATSPARPSTRLAAAHRPAAEGQELLRAALIPKLSRTG
jgi:hypothetical protein